MRKILITGGAGFIGSHVVEEMCNAFPRAEIVVLDKMTYAADINYLLPLIQSKRVQLAVGDICDYAFCVSLMNKCDLVIHAAAVSDYGVAGIETASGPVDTAAKIKSDADELLIRLKRHPKLLSHMREKSGNPDLILIGFKLTSDEAPDAITKDVNKQITESGCDFVVQNSLKDIHPEPGRHRYHLYDKTAHRLDSVEGAEALAAQLAQLCLQSGKGTHASGA